MPNVLVLINRPEYLNIPYFAMPHPSSRENSLSRLDLNRLSKMVGRRCADWLEEHRGQIELITTRNYIPLKTAFHANWLAFHDPAIAESFLAAWPRYDAQKQLKSLRTERESLAGKIEQRLPTGKFDLSRLPEQDRLPVARRYVELREKLSDLDQYIKDLEFAAELSKQWVMLV